MTKGDLNSDEKIDYSDLAILGNIVAGVAQLPDIDIIVNTSDGPKSGWTVKYYNYDISGNEDYLGEGITDSVYGNLLIPSNISKHKYIKLESSPNDGAQDILTRIITKFEDNNWQDGDMGKKYSAIIIGSDLPNINWSIQLTIISTLLHKSLDLYLENNDNITGEQFEQIYYHNKQSIENSLNIGNMYENPYSTKSEHESSYKFVASGVKILLIILIIYKTAAAAPDPASSDPPSEQGIWIKSDLVLQSLCEVLLDASGTNIPLLDDEYTIDYVVKNTQYLLDKPETQNNIKDSIINAFKYIDDTISDSSGNISEILINIHKSKKIIEAQAHITNFDIATINETNLEEMRSGGEQEFGFNDYSIDLYTPPEPEPEPEPEPQPEPEPEISDFRTTYFDFSQSIGQQLENANEEGFQYQYSFAMIDNIDGIECTKGENAYFDVNTTNYPDGYSISDFGSTIEMKIYRGDHSSAHDQKIISFNSDNEELIQVYWLDPGDYDLGLTRTLPMLDDSGNILPYSEAGNSGGLWLKIAGRMEIMYDFEHSKIYDINQLKNKWITLYIVIGEDSSKKRLTPYHDPQNYGNTRSYIKLENDSMPIELLTAGYKDKYYQEGTLLQNIDKIDIGLRTGTQKGGFEYINYLSIYCF